MHGRLDASGGAQHPGRDPGVLHDPVRGSAGALVVGLHDEILILKRLKSICCAWNRAVLLGPGQRMGGDDQHHLVVPDVFGSILGSFGTSFKMAKSTSPSSSIFSRNPECSSVMIMSTFGYCLEKGEGYGAECWGFTHRQGEPEPSLFLFVDIAELVLQLLLDLHDPLRVVQKALALVGQQETVAHALEQRDADAFSRLLMNRLRAGWEM